MIVIFLMIVLGIVITRVELVYRFRKDLLSKVYNYNCYVIKNKHPQKIIFFVNDFPEYSRMVFSIKRLKIENWCSDEKACKILKSM